VNIMIDIQSTRDSRNISIDRVGVKNLLYPVKVRQMSGGYQQTIARIHVLVDLQAQNRGTHMSRLVEVIDSFSGHEMTIFTIPEILNQLRSRLESQTAEIDIQFPYFLRKQAPISKIGGMVDYNCNFHGRLDGELVFQYGVSAPISSVCPCSKEISDFGAHNQRGEVKVDIRSKKDALVWFEDLIGIIESSASSPIYSILKREDEKFVTESAYKKPVFVEDIVRDIAGILNEDVRLTWFRVEAAHHESIHNHDAFAVIEKNVDKFI